MYLQSIKFCDNNLWLVLFSVLSIWNVLVTRIPIYIYIYLQGLRNDDVGYVMPLVHPLLTLCQLGDQGEEIQVNKSSS